MSNSIFYDLNHVDTQVNTTNIHQISWVCNLDGVAVAFAYLLHDDRLTTQPNCLSGHNKIMHMLPVIVEHMERLSSVLLTLCQTTND